MNSLPSLIRTLGVVALFATPLRAASLSPADWPDAEREALVQREVRGWSPVSPRTLDGQGGLVSATVSPIAVHAGVEALRLGGTAADAAIATATTQVVTQAGSVVSFAGILTGLYYEAKTGRIHSLDAGFNTYLGENEPSTIPASSLGGMFAGAAAGDSANPGRKTLVPGFFSGVGALHARFGRLPLAKLLEPAIWFADRGIPVSPTLGYFFSMRAETFNRTEGGREFLGQSGKALPTVGDTFRQPALANSLRCVAQDGTDAFYRGQWARDFVTVVRSAGGRVALDDLERYRPTWSEAVGGNYLGYRVFTNASPHAAAYALFPALNLMAVDELEKRGTYSNDPYTFQALHHYSTLLVSASAGMPAFHAFLKGKGISVPDANPLSLDYARELQPKLAALRGTIAVDKPRHSNAIVVVDREGNIAAFTHTINTLVWGETGLVVGGIPIPDTAGFQQARLATLTPGDRLPHEILDVIALDDHGPVLATASIGSSLLPETLRTLLGVLGQHHSLRDETASPPILLTFDPTKPDTITLPAGGFPLALADALRKQGRTIDEVSPEVASGLRGTLAAVSLSGTVATAVEQPGVMVFAEKSE